MAPGPDLYSDEYVAQVMKQDAQSSSIKYSALGLEAFRPKRPTGAGPKPNTRFLANLLKDTDSHNTSLLQKEQHEARERKRALERAGQTLAGSGRARDHDRFRDYKEYAGKRRREDESGLRDEEERPRKRRSRSRSPIRRGRDYDDHQRRHRQKSDDEDDRQKHRRRHDKDDVYTNRRHHSRRDEEDHGGERRLGSLRQRSYSSDRSRSPTRSSKRRHDSGRDDGSHGKKRHRSHRDEQVGPGSPTRHKQGRQQQVGGPEDHHSKPSISAANAQLPPEYESDPLEAILGPLPPPPIPEARKRGRGAFVSSGAAMDSRFDSTYDPTVDVQPDPDTEDDWEQAVEAMRDRMKWKQKGADRLRAAGFSETEVKKWEKGDTKDESDVKWVKAGEGREWDRGKVVDDEGNTELKAEWGRLT